MVRLLRSGPSFCLIASGGSSLRPLTCLRYVRCIAVEDSLLTLERKAQSVHLPAPAKCPDSALLGTDLPLEEMLTAASS